ncbi:MAG TPA: hypothetical protein VGB77_03835 [Abditibacteriaceae bacterium]|jgi:hypothetical protein
MKTLFLLLLLAVIFTVNTTPVVAKAKGLSTDSVSQMLPMQKGKPVPTPTPKPIGPRKSGDE